MYQLTNSGYDIQKFIQISKIIGNLNREDLIPYKEKNSQFNRKENRIKTFLNFDYNQQFLKDTIKNSFSIVSSNIKYNWTKDYKIDIFNKMLPN